MLTKNYKRLKKFKTKNWLEVTRCNFAKTFQKFAEKKHPLHGYGFGNTCSQMSSSELTVNNKLIGVLENHILDNAMKNHVTVLLNFIYLALIKINSLIPSNLNLAKNSGKLIMVTILKKKVYFLSTCLFCQNFEN